MSATYDDTGIKLLVDAIAKLLKPDGRNSHLPRGSGGTRTEYKDGRAAAAIGQLGPSPTSYANRGNEKATTALPPLESLAESVAATQKQVKTSVTKLFGDEGNIPDGWQDWPTSMIGTGIAELDKLKAAIEASGRPLPAKMYEAELDYVRKILRYRNEMEIMEFGLKEVVQELDRRLAEEYLQTLLQFKEENGNLASYPPVHELGLRCGEDTYSRYGLVAAIRSFTAPKAGSSEIKPTTPFSNPGGNGSAPNKVFDSFKNSTGPSGPSSNRPIIGDTNNKNASQRTSSSGSSTPASPASSSSSVSDGNLLRFSGNPGAASSNSASSSNRNQDILQ